MRHVIKPRNNVGPMVLSVLLLSTLAACVTTPPPSDQVAVARAAIETARSSGAAELAPAELNIAREKLRRAEQLALAGNRDEARVLAEEADVDAQAARSKSAAIRANRALYEVEASLNAVREESSRATMAPAVTTGVRP